MWFLWDLKCWSKISLKDTGFLEDTSGGSLSRWGGARLGQRGSLSRVGMATASGPPEAEPRDGIAHPHSHGDSAERRCCAGTCCGWIREQCSLFSKMLAEDPEVLIAADGIPALGAPGLPVAGRGRPISDLFHQTVSLGWGFSHQLGLTLGSRDSLLLWMDVL